MNRVSISAAWVLFVSLLATPSMAVEPDSPSVAGVQSEIYRIFLNTWISSDKTPVNVSRRAEPLSPDDIKVFDDCSDGKHKWVSIVSGQDLAGQLADLSYVRLVNPDTWKPKDPAELMAHGRSVDSAVGEGINNGLMTLSVVALDTTAKTAALRYAFVCGALCGSGGAVLFTLTPQGWAMDQRQCGGWIS
ncbi:MAG: hypothetical protein JO006_09355 [Paucibacter sp.]|nr:hypothetical protein [Roseateles sp.]